MVLCMFREKSWKFTELILVFSKKYAHLESALGGFREGKVVEMCEADFVSFSKAYARTLGNGAF